MNEAGTIRVVVDLAKGGMGSVHLALRRGRGGFERLVAVKRIHAHLLADPEFSALIREEARVASMLHHANVVAIQDVVEQGGELLLVMDYVESVTLADLLKLAGGAMPDTIALRILDDMLAGLEAVHTATDLHGDPLQIVHRDVSPQNVIVGLDGIARVIDFGVAKAKDRISLTTAQTVRGKPAYFAPEQAMGAELDSRADVFAAAVVSFEVLCRKHPFRGDNEQDTLRRLLIEELTPPSRVRPDLAPAYEVALRGALARLPEERTASAAALRAALRRGESALAERDEVARFVSGVASHVIDARRAALRGALAEVTPAEARRPPSSLPDQEPSQPTALPTTTHLVTTRGSSSRSWMVVASIGIALAIGALVVVRSAKHTTSTPQEATSSPPQIRPAEPVASASTVTTPTAPASAETPTIAPEATGGAPAAAGSPKRAGQGASRPSTPRVRPSAPTTKPDAGLRDNPYGAPR